MPSNYEIVIGLEVHVHLKTETKLFCRCKNEFGADPNTQICPVCTGQPGVLPAINKKAVEQAVRAAVALGCRINAKSVFARKQYFYPDLPKNYQISQYELPIASDGSLDVGGREILLTRAHMEEDAGKLIHTDENISLVDYNRTGTPLLEIVSEPEIDSPTLASDYLKSMRMLLRWYDISDCDMEKGSMRCDANISLRNPGEGLGVKVEIKNLNSFKAVEKALEYEYDRQTKKLDDSEIIVQETRLWDDDRGMTLSMRSKEEANDYRYFPEPDLPVLVVGKEFKKKIFESMPKSPAEKQTELAEKYDIDESRLDPIFTAGRDVVDYFEKAADSLNKVEGKPHTYSGKVCQVINWITGDLFGRINSEGIEFCVQPVKPEYLAGLIDLIEDGTVSGKMAKDVFRIMWDTGKEASEIIKEKGMKQISSDDEIEKICMGVITNSPDIVKKYQEGKEGVLGALVGSVMKETKGQANPQLVNEKLRDLLSKKSNDN